MSSSGWTVTIIAILIILTGAWWFTNSQAPAADTTVINTGANAAGTMPTGSQTPDNGMVGGDADANVDVSAGGTQTSGTTIHYTASGFAPANVSISAGQKVTFVNDTAGAMWVAADEHPTHTEFDGTDRATHCSGTYTGATPFDQCQPGSSYTFVFTKAGAYEYHNHSAAQFGGTVTVK